MPIDTLHSDEWRLTHLGTRPLGEILFADPRLERISLELTEIESLLWQQDLAGELETTPSVWGRRSLYTMGSSKFLVAEFFLPSLLTGEMSR
jgi:chorismate--pyruvate lyase